MSGQIIDASLVSAPSSATRMPRRKQWRRADPRGLERASGDAPPGGPRCAWTLVFGKAASAKTAPGTQTSLSRSSATKATPASTGPRVHPEVGRDRRQPARWEDASLPSPRRNEHWHHRPGRQRLSLEGERSLHGPAPLPRPGPPPQAAGTADGAAHPPRQTRPLEGPRRHRARVRSAEGADGPLHPHRRHRAGEGEDRPRQSHPQTSADWSSTNAAQRWHDDHRPTRINKRPRRHPRTACQALLLQPMPRSHATIPGR
jgi:hypothetical protein